MDGPTRDDYKGMVDYLKNEKRLRTKIFKQEIADLDRQIELFEKEADRKWPATKSVEKEPFTGTCVTFAAGFIDWEEESES